VPDRGIPFIHYKGEGNDPKKTNNDCNFFSSTMTTDFHTYTMEWTPEAIRVYYDGQLCLENTNWMPTNGISKPSPFDQPFNINLTQALGMFASPFNNFFTDGTTPLPATAEIDYVHVWQRPDLLQAS
jgi:beta-glucanase (GH16 family)